jgi:hypothetical protein
MIHIKISEKQEKYKPKSINEDGKKGEYGCWIFYTCMNNRKNLLKPIYEARQERGRIMEGINYTAVHYMHKLKYPNETSCTTIIY